MRKCTISGKILFILNSLAAGHLKKAELTPLQPRPFTITKHQNMTKTMQDC